MRRILLLLLLLCATGSALYGDEPAKILVQQRPFLGHYVLDARIWWLEANALAGAIGLRQGELQASVMPPDHMQFQYQGKTFQVSARRYKEEIFLDAEAFVKGLGGKFSCPPATPQVQIEVPLALVAPPPAPTRPAASPTASQVAVEAFKLAAVGPRAAAGIPLQTHLDLNNLTQQTLTITLRIMEGDNTLNQQGPVTLPPGKHVAEWAFTASPNSANIRVLVLLGNQVVAMRPMDANPAPAAAPSAAPSEAPASDHPLDATPGGNPPGF